MIEFDDIVANASAPVTSDNKFDASPVGVNWLMNLGKHLNPPCDDFKDRKHVRRAQKVAVVEFLAGARLEPCQSGDGTALAVVLLVLAENRIAGGIDQHS